MLTIKFDPSRIVCLLYFGSSAVTGKGNDHDLVLILDRWNKDDLSKIKTVISKFEKIDFILQYQDWLLERGYSNYQIVNHGQHFFHCLAEAQTLIGTNIFKKHIAGQTKNDEVHSLLIKIEEYFGRLDRQFLISERIAFLQFSEKYLARICADMLLIDKSISYKQASCMSNMKAVHGFIKDTGCISRMTTAIIARQITRNPSKFILDDFLALRESLYRDYLLVLKKYNKNIKVD